MRKTPITAVTDWSLPEQADWLRQQGITHIFIGAKGGFFDPTALLQNPQTRLIYATTAHSSLNF